ncbi:MAG: hypothetical protein ABH834_00815 [Candidatus Altiarchaeota archaeon]
MVEASVILVEPKYEGNIGAIARVMANFGVSEFADDKGAVFTSLALAR